MKFGGLGACSFRKSFVLRRLYESLLKIGHGLEKYYLCCMLNDQGLIMGMLNFHNLVSKVWIVDQSMPNHSRYYIVVV